MKWAWSYQPSRTARSAWSTPGLAFDLERGLLQPVTAQHPLDRHADVAAEYALCGACAPRRVLHHLLHPVQPIVVADPVDQCRQGHIGRIDFAGMRADELIEPR